jgi:hypothetical protein
MNSGNQSQELYRLHFWEEASGILFDLNQDGDAIIAHFDKVFLALPIAMEEKMRALIGHHVSVLRTDEFHRPYLFRELKCSETNEEEI